MSDWAHAICIYFLDMTAMSKKIENLTVSAVQVCAGSAGRFMHNTNIHQPVHRCCITHITIACDHSPCTHTPTSNLTVVTTTVLMSTNPFSFALSTDAPDTTDAMKKPSSSFTTTTTTAMTTHPAESYTDAVNRYTSSVTNMRSAASSTTGAPVSTLNPVFPFGKLNTAASSLPSYTGDAIVKRDTHFDSTVTALTASTLAKFTALIKDTILQRSTALSDKLKKLEADAMEEHLHRLTDDLTHLRINTIESANADVTNKIESFAQRIHDMRESEVRIFVQQYKRAIADVHSQQMSDFKRQCQQIAHLEVHNKITEFVEVYNQQRAALLQMTDSADAEFKRKLADCADTRDSINAQIKQTLQDRSEQFTRSTNAMITRLKETTDNMVAAGKTDIASAIATIDDRVADATRTLTGMLKYDNTRYTTMITTMESRIEELETAWKTSDANTTRTLQSSATNTQAAIDSLHTEFEHLRNGSVTQSQLDSLTRTIDEQRGMIKEQQGMIEHLYGQLQDIKNSGVTSHQILDALVSNTSGDDSSSSAH